MRIKIPQFQKKKVFQSSLGSFPYLVHIQHCRQITLSSVELLMNDFCF